MIKGEVELQKLLFPKHVQNTPIAHSVLPAINQCSDKLVKSVQLFTTCYRQRQKLKVQFHYSGKLPSNWLLVSKFKTIKIVLG